MNTPIEPPSASLPPETSEGAVGNPRGGSRRRSVARLAAVQAIYQLEVNRGVDPETVVREFAGHRFGREIDGDQYGEADPALFSDIVIPPRWVVANMLFSNWLNYANEGPPLICVISSCNQISRLHNEIGVLLDCRENYLPVNLMMSSRVTINNKSRQSTIVVILGPAKRYKQHYQNNKQQDLMCYLTSYIGHRSKR